MLVARVGRGRPTSIGSCWDPMPEVARRGRNNHVEHCAVHQRLSSHLGRLMANSLQRPGNLLLEARITVKRRILGPSLFVGLEEIQVIGQLANQSLKFRLRLEVVSPHDRLKTFHMPGASRSVPKHLLEQIDQLGHRRHVRYPIRANRGDTSWFPRMTVCDVPAHRVRADEQVLAANPPSRTWAMTMFLGSQYLAPFSEPSPPFLMVIPCSAVRLRTCVPYRGPLSTFASPTMSLARARLPCGPGDGHTARPCTPSRAGTALGHLGHRATMASGPSRGVPGCPNLRHCHLSRKPLAICPASITMNAPSRASAHRPTRLPSRREDRLPRRLLEPHGPRRLWFARTSSLHACHRSTNTRSQS